jgi:hypothetical protein
MKLPNCPVSAAPFTVTGRTQLERESEIHAPFEAVANCSSRSVLHYSHKSESDTDTVVTS